MSDKEWPEEYISAGKRTKLRTGTLTDWFVGYGKDRSCQFEGNWHAMIAIAAKILSSPNTKIAVENSELPEEFYQPELRDLAEEHEEYTASAYEFEELPLGDKDQ